MRACIPRRGFARVTSTPTVCGDCSLKTQPVRKDSRSGGKNSRQIRGNVRCRNLKAPANPLGRSRRQSLSAGWFRLCVRNDPVKYKRGSKSWERTKPQAHHGIVWQGICSEFRWQTNCDDTSVGQRPPTLATAMSAVLPGGAGMREEGRVLLGAAPMAKVRGEGSARGRGSLPLAGRGKGGGRVFPKVRVVAAQ